LEKTIVRTRLGTPKYRWTWSGLFVLGLGLGLFYVRTGRPEWVSELAAGMIAATVFVLLAGPIAERKASERHHPKTRENQWVQATPDGASKVTVARTWGENGSACGVG
jgi:hypothetical protein